MAYPYPYPGPIAPYNNLPIHTDYFQPSNFNISAISRGQQTTVTTSVAHNFVVGQLVKLLIPASFGTVQLNGKSGYVLSLPSTTQVLLDIFSTNADAFISSSAATKAQIVATGDINSGAINAAGPNTVSTSAPGVFLNISP